MEDQPRIHYVDALLQSLIRDADSAKERWALVPKHFKSAPPECRTLWTEVIFCFTFGQLFAALAVCGAFVEYFLERAIPAFCMRTGKNPVAIPDKLHDQIKLAASIDLISQDEGKLLQDFRKLIRNRFDHADIVAIANSLASIERVGIAWVEQGEVRIHFFSEDVLEGLRTVTIKERVEKATRILAPPVIRWVGNWAGDCSRKVWGPKLV